MKFDFYVEVRILIYDRNRQLDHMAAHVQL